MNSKMQRISSISCAALAIMLLSCADDGFDDSEKFESTVRNAQLVSPTIQPSDLSVVNNPDGTESVRVQWPVVEGASGYLANVAIVDNPETPDYIVKGQMIDGCSMTFNRQEDTKYKIYIKAIGNKKFNNTDAPEASVIDYSSYVTAIEIPENEEIAEFVKKNLPAPGTETAFALKAGGTYRLNDAADFNLVQCQLRGDKNNHPTVIVGEKGCIKIQNGFKLRYINFDCKDMNNVGLIRLADVADPTLRFDALGYNGGNAAKAFLIKNPVMIQHCWIKDLKAGVIAGSNEDWSLADFRLEDCIIQLHLDKSFGDKSLLNLQYCTAEQSIGGWKSCAHFKDLSVKNNTIFNTQVNDKTYFIRYANGSNSDPSKTWGPGHTSTHKWFNNTLIRTFTGKDFGNNIQKGVTHIMENNIFYDTYRINKYARGTKQIKDNVFCYKDGRKIDGGDSSFGSVDDGLNFDFSQTMDFSKPNAGLNFKPNTSTNAGDTRWFK